ncbi:prolipoprotein diacylglyceryl transferase [Tessaracoccus sp. OS52]|uniref:prolipoprotein diacylglyceryl transferase n=1 Tax=Tessaracoccus sp. OS52 TaxID=2886691 RepID=UPI001D106A13|nr:prolipoprotein diacylglyceryl transferase [Tessaracoccus sp. OS52]
MWPELFSVFGFQVQSYGVSKALALLVGGFLLGRTFQRIGYDRDLAYSLALWATVWGFVGAKLYFLVANLDHLSWHMLGGSGFVWYGGLIGGSLAVLVLTRRNHLSLAKVVGAMAAPLSVAYGIGRIGCFLAGDGTYGKPTDLPWGMAFPNGAVPINVPVHPAQLYEAAGAFLIAGILWIIARRMQPAAVFGSYLILSGLARLLVEFVRINNPILLGLTEAQVFGAASILGGAILLVRYALHGQATTPEADRTSEPEIPAVPVVAARTSALQG